jgi:cation diffusion facilitator family transporter
MSAADTAATTAQRGKRAIRLSRFSLFINALLAAAKGVAGVAGNSYALLADAIESLLDVFSSLIVWSGVRIAIVPPDADHPYGHGKAEPLAAIVVSLFLLVAAAGLAFQSVREILAPHNAPHWATLVVLVAVVAIKEGMFRLIKRGNRKVKSTALSADAWHHRSDAITSGAAFVGISIALAGGQGYESADDYAALFACGIIAFNGYRLMRPALDEVMDAAPDPAIERRVRSIAHTVDGVRDLHVCVIRKIGFDFFVDLHVLVDPELTVKQGHEIAHNVKDAIRREDSDIRDVLIHIEPYEGPQMHSVPAAKPDGGFSGSSKRPVSGA